MSPDVMCDYCGRPARFLASSEAIYRGRNFGPVYRCDPCDAHVGCHPGTTKPLGRLANSELRRAKSAAHAAFDALWLAKQRRTGCSKQEARGAGYRWLAGVLDIDPAACHIGMFDVAQCQRVVEVCSATRRGKVVA